MKKIILPVLLAQSLFATDYHVDLSSTETTEDGSAQYPFKTIAQATAAMVAGDTCYIHEGIYREMITTARSGTVDAPIRYVAFQDDDVIIAGTNLVENWELHEGSIYKVTNVDMAKDENDDDLELRNMLYFEADAQQLARWPNDLDGDPFTYDAYKIKTDAGTYSNSYITHDDIPDYWDDGVMFWLGAHSGCAVMRSITGFDENTNRLSFLTFPEAWPFGTHSPNRWENGHRGIFYLMNKLEALDAPSEWYYDQANRTLYFYPPEGVDPSTGTVEVSRREWTVNLSHHYIEFDKLNFFGAPLRLNGNHCKVSNARIRHCVAELITDSTSATAGGAAVLIYADNIHLDTCLIEEGSATGVNIGMNADNAIVENCVIRNFNTQGNHCSPIRSSGPNALITRNRLYGSARDVSRATGRDSVFSYNEVSHGLLANTDGGLFYVTGNSQPVNVELHHNWFHTVDSPDYTSNHSTGIYLDNNSAGFKVHHNVVWDVPWGGLHFNWDALENEIYNNTFWNVGYDLDEEHDYAVILCWIPERNGRRTDVRDNILHNNLSDVREWWDSGAGSYTEDETLDNTFTNNAQVTSDAFVSAAEGNFMPTNHSTIVDQGLTIDGVTDGHLGTAPDMGAYEYGAERWIPGPDWQPEEFSWLLPSILNRISFSNWILEYTLDEADRLMDADPDGDGRKNFFEYAFGGDPTKADDQGGYFPEIRSSSSGINLSHITRDDANDITYHVETSTTLEPDSWTPLSQSIQTLEEVETGLTQRLQELGTGADKVFIRIRVTPNLP
ncbi:right-handed parallel beta-helix repeat-containing protein [Pelagicoccus mobilis]|uniref:Right-handed parallel beta-helix repeat-containing protein n=1 Tax=Pelagicoccus mobilis TaxID=415221 RepID=A0A934RXX9_9BACT|nr:right-handed parallel beta-helix repeat-containing protein [Pelagicoccus mobilis]MBK1877515.1 right-handed parallel beta-helix repeat-containing protein [Pelagicoccus mobilis]